MSDDTYKFINTWPGQRPGRVPFSEFLQNFFVCAWWVLPRASRKLEYSCPMRSQPAIHQIKNDIAVIEAHSRQDSA